MVRGTGDVTLSRRATGPTLYRNAARLSDLARQVSDKVKLLPIKPKRLIVDTSYYTGPTMAYGWDRWDIGGGSVAPMAPPCWTARASSTPAGATPVPPPPPSNWASLWPDT
ncbi:MAG: hypothetical protein U1U88_001782 [Lawsonella clevelandensis]